MPLLKNIGLLDSGSTRLDQLLDFLDGARAHKPRGCEHGVKFDHEGTVFFRDFFHPQIEKELQTFVKFSASGSKL